ncbi:MAG: amidohydrolase [Bacteroidetes bacterium]|nr:amidohydrolase [Bacteroidota bacterium]
MIKIVKNVTIVPMTHEVTFWGAVAFEDGKIIMVSQGNQEADRFIEELNGDVEVIDGKGGILLPGFINLHNHVSMTLLRSYADDIPLMPWLTEKIWPVEDKMTPEHIYVGAKLGIAEMLLGGTTTFVDMYASEDMVAKAGVELGMRTVLGLAFLDQSFPYFEAFAEKLIEKYGKENGLVSLTMSPHAPYTCSPETLEKAVAFAKKHNLMVHTHLSETETEIKQIRERYDKTPVEYFRDLGLFDQKTIAAHCVYLEDSDMKIMRDYGVSVSHNPQSNMKLGSGIAPVKKMMDYGINVGLGTDGPSSNNDLDMWEEMRSASFLQKVVALDPTILPAYEILKMATVNGAKALNRDDLGTIAVGQTADFMIIDTSKPHFFPCHDVIANLVYCGKASDVDTVFVNGKMVVRSKELMGDNLSNIYNQVQCAINELEIAED